MSLKKLTLQEILENPTEVIVVDEKEITVKCPTTREKLEAKKEATTSPGWESLTPLEQNVEVARRTALKMLVDPKFTVDQYLESNDAKMTILLDTVSMWYSTKMKVLNDKRKTVMDHFLEQMKEISP